MVAVLLLVTVQATSTIAVFPTVDTFIDGNTSEWSGGETIRLHPANGSPGVESSGEFEDGDVTVEVRVGFSTNGLHFALKWWDNTWNTATRARSQSVFVGTDGQRHDAMYFSDNLKIQIRGPTVNYVAWFSPHDGGHSPYQWHTVRPRNGATDSETDTPPAAIVRQNGLVTIEVLVAWDALGLETGSFDTLDLLIVAVDSDETTDMQTPPADVRFIPWSGRLLGERGF